MLDGSPIENAKKVQGNKTGGQFFFTPETNVVELKIAVSSVSIANAKANLVQYGKDLAFDQVKKATNGQWEELLSKIRVETPQDSLKTIFLYCSISHSNCPRAV